MTWSTSNGRASGYYDYTPLSNQLVTFQPGQSSRTIQIPLLADTGVEGTEEFYVDFASTTLTLERSFAMVTLRDNDLANRAPVASVGDVVVDETVGTAQAVIVLDRDTLPDGLAARMAVGQGAHTHQLLKAGELSLERLLPGITREFIAAGAKEMVVGRDVKVFDFGGWMEDCDAGFTVTSLSRPAYEGILRRRVAALPGMSIRHETSVKRFVVAGGACVGVELEDGGTLAADLCVDATGMAGPLMLERAAKQGRKRLPGGVKPAPELVDVRPRILAAEVDVAAGLLRFRLDMFSEPGEEGPSKGVRPREVVQALCGAPVADHRVCRERLLARGEGGALVGLRGLAPVFNAMGERWRRAAEDPAEAAAAASE